MGQKKPDIYLQQKRKIQFKVDDVIRVGDLMDIVCEDENLKRNLQILKIYKINENDGNRLVISKLKVMNVILEYIEADLRVYGPDSTIVEIGNSSSTSSFWKGVMVFCVYVLVFIGAAMAIMNFHEDVSLYKAHEHIYKMFTGRENARPLVIQIPYSIGIGVGMIVFFNHIYKKKINDEPSPLELEMDNYQTEVDDYIRMHPEETNQKENSR